MRAKNLCSKTRPFDQPYEIWDSFDGTWVWHVLKKYQAPENEKLNLYARWFCAVKSPFTHGGWEYGDVYVADIVYSALKRESQ